MLRWTESNSTIETFALGGSVAVAVAAGTSKRAGALGIGGAFAYNTIGTVLDASITSSLVKANPDGASSNAGSVSLSASDDS